MRSLRLPEMIAVMEAKGPQVTIEFEAGAADRIAGRLLDQQGEYVPFDGWLGLAAVIERVLAPPDRPGAVAPDRHEAQG